MKTINTKVSKRIVTIVLAAAAALSLMGCSVEKNFTTTETHTYTDADGNTTTTTTTNHNGEVTTETTSYTEEDATSYTDEEAMEYTEDDMDAEEVSVEGVYENVPVSFTNDMGWDIAEFYVKMSGQDEWSDNFLSEGQFISDGDTANGITVNYNEDQHFMDIRVADYTASEEVFEKIELPAEGAENIEIVFEYDEVSDSFIATVHAE